MKLSELTRLPQWIRLKKPIENWQSKIIQIKVEMRKSFKKYKELTISFLTRKKEKCTINMVWKVSKEVVEVVVEWTIFSACSWVEEVVVPLKNKNNV